MICWPPLILSRTTSASTTTWRGSSVLSLSPPLSSFFRADCPVSSLARGVWRGSGADGIQRREWDGFTWTASSSAPTLSGTVARWDLQHKLWELENSLCLRVLREAGGDSPQTRHRPGEQHHPLSHTLHLCLRKIDDDNSGEHGRPWHRAAILPPCWGEKLHMVVDVDQSDSVKGGGGQWWGVSED